MNDQLIKFVLADGLVRGAAVRLDATWQEMLARRTYPKEIQSLLGDMCAGLVAMAGSIKFDGSLILQMMGEGSLRLAVAECQPGLGMRATAKWTEPLVTHSLEAMLGASINATQHSAKCVITLDPKNRKPGQQAYQGIVALHDDKDEPFTTLAQVLANYMQKSEQIDTRFVLASDGTQACALMLQRMPHEGGKGSKAAQEKAWQEHERTSYAAFDEALVMLPTVKAEELLNTESATLLHRLFWEQGLKMWDASAETGTPHFHCTCSRDKVRGMLQMLGRDEVESIIAERGEVEVSCDFCGAQYRFDPVDAAQALLDAAKAVAGTTLKQ
jgi:molecular chaperone Hsp33